MNQPTSLDGKRDCTELFMQYREMARLIWNLAFWAKAEVRASDCFQTGDYVAAFREIAARLYEGMVLLPLGYEDRVIDIDSPGRTVPFHIELKYGGTKLLVARNGPTEPGRIYENHKLPLDLGSYELIFVDFFDWSQLDLRDFRFFEVLIKRLDAKPEYAGHHGLIEVTDCCVWLYSDPDWKTGADDGHLTNLLK